MSKGKMISKASELVRWRPKPTISITSDDLAMVKKMEVNKTYEFTVTAKVKSVSAGDEYSDEYDDEPSDKATRARLVITKIKEK